MTANKENNSGQTLIEFALIIPVFLLLVFGLLDLGRAVYYYSAIHNAAREGARYSIVHYDRNPVSFSIAQKNAIRNVVQEKAVAVGLLISDITVDLRYYSSNDKYTSEVCVNDYPFSPITPLIADVLGAGGNILMSSCSEMQMEY